MQKVYDEHPYRVRQGGRAFENFDDMFWNAWSALNSQTFSWAWRKCRLLISCVFFCLSKNNDQRLIKFGNFNFSRHLSICEPKNKMNRRNSLTSMSDPLGTFSLLRDFTWQTNTNTNVTTLQFRANWRSVSSTQTRQSAATCTNGRRYSWRTWLTKNMVSLTHAEIIFQFFL